MPRSWFVAAITLAGVGVSVGMIVLGLPEATPGQTLLLELSSLPLSGSVALGLWHLAARLRPFTVVARGALLTCAAGALAGVAVVVSAYALGPRSLVHIGQLIIWAALLAALVFVITRLPRRSPAEFTWGEGDAASTPDGDQDSSL